MCVSTSPVAVLNLSTVGPTVFSLLFSDETTIFTHILNSNWNDSSCCYTCSHFFFFLQCWRVSVVPLCNYRIREEEAWEKHMCFTLHVFGSSVMQEKAAVCYFPAMTRSHFKPSYLVSTTLHHWLISWEGKSEMGVGNGGGYLVTSFCSSTEHWLVCEF